MASYRLILWLVLAAGVLRTQAAEGEPELHARRGLPGVAARVAAGEALRVAYLGGSITAADGWRSLTLRICGRVFRC